MAAPVSGIYLAEEVEKLSLYTDYDLNCTKTAEMFPFFMGMSVSSTQFFIFTLVDKQTRYTI